MKEVSGRSLTVGSRVYAAGAYSSTTAEHYHDTFYADLELKEKIIMSQIRRNVYQDSLPCCEALHLEIKRLRAQRHLIAALDVRVISVRGEE